MIDLFVWTLTGVSRKVDNGVVEGVGARSVMNIVQTMILISSLLKIITLGVALWFASKQSMSDFKLGHVHIPLCSLDM
jgi:hypothetical protein